MRFSLNWIRDYVDVEEDPAVLAHRLTMAGLPVDRVERPAPLPASVVVGKVLEVRRHPNADRLSLCRVDAGNGETVEVVCGAPNVREGMFSPLARVGTTLPNGMTLTRAKIRGEVSEGMLCSAVELGVGEDKAGIMELGPAEPGTPVSRVLGTGDVVLEIDVPSNRGDCLSHVGLAREIAALTGGSLRPPEASVKEAGAPVEGVFSVEVEDAADCPRFTAHLVRGVRIAPSPAWLVKRLEAVGQRAINNVVDVTNFVMLELGQPLHAYDLARLATGRILVRRARAGETLTTLDGVDRRLEAGVLVITDGDRPIGAAGVMGGAGTEVHDGTTEVLLEAAWFKPQRVLRGSRALRLDTEAAIRFRRGVDPAGVAGAARRAAMLLAKVSGGTVAPGMVEAVDAAFLEPARVSLRPAKVGETLGEAVDPDEVAGRLVSLGFRCEREDEPWTVTVPTWRRDVLEECDLVEEVARHRGYDAIGSRMANVSGVDAPVQPEEVRRRRVGELLRGLGFHEAITPVLTRREAAGEVGIDPETAGAAFVPLDEAFSSEAEGLRVSLVPSLLDAAARNLRHGTPEVALYELGKTFDRRSGGKLPVETEWVGLVAVGGGFAPSRERARRSLDFLEFKGFVEALLASHQIDSPRWRPYDRLDLAPAGSIGAWEGERDLGFVWEAPEAVRERRDLGRPVFAAQIRLDALPPEEGAPRTFRELARFPAVRRDLALVVPDGTAQAQVREWIREDAGEHLAGLELFDHYRGRHIPAGHVGLGFSLTFRAVDRTLEEKDVDAAVDRIVTGLRRRNIVRREG